MRCQLQCTHPTVTLAWDTVNNPFTSRARLGRICQQCGMRLD